jgi:hypothetical protein
LQSQYKNHKKKLKRGGKMPDKQKKKKELPKKYTKNKK